LGDVRAYGKKPYSIAIIHGGPGAAGEMRPVAEVLSEDHGVIEPLQTASSVKGQMGELLDQLERYARFPVVLVGYSWGAWLVSIFTARYPDLVSKLILISSGPFEERYTEGIMETRMERLTPEEQKESYRLQSELETADGENKERIFKRFGTLMSKADSYDPIEDTDDGLQLRPGIYENVWPEASAMRSSGKLLDTMKRISCPVIAIHGDHDPHPAEGVKVPLSGTLADFTMHRLEKCGHTPWKEKQVREKFYEILKSYLTV
jgi:pimeloyl-ACP methyl ester carboxylesterase